MDAAVVQLNNAGKEFEAREAAQLNSWQETIQKCNKVAAGIAVEQKESFNAAIKRMQEGVQQGKEQFAEVRQAASTSSEGGHAGARLHAPAKSFGQAYGSAKPAFDHDSSSSCRSAASRRHDCLQRARRCADPL